MTNMFAEEGNRTLSDLARSKLLVAFDYDGTLAPIVSDREHATMRPDTRRLVADVCSLYPCAVISGRSRTDVEKRLDGIRIKHVVGNHGIEPCSRMAQFESDTAEAYRFLTAQLASRDDIEVENKRYSLAVHYRKSPHRADARRTIRAAIKALPKPMRTVPGKLVFNVMSPDAPNKGNALLQVMRKEEAEAALYLGDDVTDEDVFRLGTAERVFAVRVGESRSSSASFFLHDQNDVDRLLEQLVEIRRSQADDGDRA
jgi:trehalose 6-phosphate phosphatase